MSASEKAKELYDKYFMKLNECLDVSYSYSSIEGEEECAKQCAIICVEQIIDGIHGVNEELELTSNVDISSHLTYYEEVLEQIKNS